MRSIDELVPEPQDGQELGTNEQFAKVLAEELSKHVSMSKTQEEQQEQQEEQEEQEGQEQQEEE